MPALTSARVYPLIIPLLGHTRPLSLPLRLSSVISLVKHDVRQCRLGHDTLHNLALSILDTALRQFLLERRVLPYSITLFAFDELGDALCT